MSTKYLSTREVAKALGVSTSKVISWATKGNRDGKQLKGIQPSGKNGKWIWDPAAIDEFLGVESAPTRGGFHFKEQRMQEQGY